MAQLENIQPTTELEAVNEMMAVIGEAPILQSELDSPSLPDVKLAVRTLRSTHREVLSDEWKFNSEEGYELPPTSDSPHAWTDTSGDTTDLNIFTPPSGLISWELTETDRLLGKDLVVRPSRDYTDGSGNPVKVFYDREENRDGLPADDFDYLYIDPLWFWDFEDCPESFRKYVTIRSARKFQSRAVGSSKLDRQNQDDEAKALRVLERKHGIRESPNMFDHPEQQTHLGRARRRHGASRIDRTDSPGLQ